MAKEKKEEGPYEDPFKDDSAPEGAIAVAERPVTPPKSAGPAGLPGLPGTHNPFQGKPPATPGGLPGGPKTNSPGDASADDEEEFEEDFEGVTTGGFIFKEGQWPAVVTGFDKVPGKNADQYEWTFKFIDGPDVGKEIKNWTSLAPNSRWVVVQSLEACGIPASGTIARFKRKDVIGKPVILDIFTDTYFSTKKNKEVTGSKIQEVMPPTPEVVEMAKKMGDKPPV